MSWQKVDPDRSNNNRRRSKQSSTSLSKQKGLNQTEAQIRSFLECYKTQPCKNSDLNHDTRHCDKFHSVEDQRRNPYKTHYLPDDGGCLNIYERMYHPNIFRTAICRNNNNDTCAFGKYCSRAHTEDQLRDRETVTDTYHDEFFCKSRPLNTIASTLTLPQEKNYYKLAQESWKEKRISPGISFLKLSNNQMFVVSHSKAIFRLMQDVAFEECLGTVKLARRNNKNSTSSLEIRGNDIDGIKARVLSLLYPPSPHFAVATKTYGERIIRKLKSDDNKRGISISNFSDNVLIEFISNETLQMTAVQSKGDSAQIVLSREIDKLDFWRKKENYDVFYECSCCYESFNKDQGIICNNKLHFYCTAGDNDEIEKCFDMLLKSQIIELSHREDQSLYCPECKASYNEREVVANLSKSVYEEYKKAIIDAEVTKKAKQMNDEFDNRLRLAVEEVLKAHGNAKSELHYKAKELAKEARNTILNLSCPHCHTAYFAFDGCMALQCQSCNKSFCGYCHQGFMDQRGAHLHVRQCLMNETTTGTYFATPGQIEIAQRKYRTREIKKFLRQHKKNLQNAVIIELEKDLKDLGIKQEALFELGMLI